MSNRPKSITIIAWILIVMGVISVFTGFLSFHNPIVKELMSKNLLPIPIQYAVMCIGLLVAIICGAGMLQAQNWARLVYVIWGVIGLLISLVTSPIKTALIPGFILLAIVVFFLYRPASNLYFAQGKTCMIRKVVSIICYCVGGFFLWLVNQISFINNPSRHTSIENKLFIIGMLSIIALIFLGIGLILRRSEKWRQDIAVVLLSVSGIAIFIVFSVACMFMSPESAKIFHNTKINSLNNYFTGAICTLIYICIGALLLIRSKKENKNNKDNVVRP